MMCHCSGIHLLKIYNMTNILVQLACYKIKMFLHGVHRFTCAQSTVLAQLLVQKYVTKFNVKGSRQRL